MDTADSSPPAEVSRVAVGLQSFWAERPAVWFAQAEEQFLLAGVCSEKTKFSHVISQLDHRYAAEVGHHHLSARMRPLYHAEDRDRKAAVPLKTAKHPPVSYTQGGRPQAVPVSEASQKPRSKCARRLPPHHLVQPGTPNIEAILVGQHEWSSEAAACCADRIFKVAPQPAFASVGQFPNTALLQQIEDLSRQVAALSAEQDSLHTSFRDPPLSSRDPCSSTRDPRPGPRNCHPNSRSSS
jgi:hypothetical protein